MAVADAGGLATRTVRGMNLSAEVKAHESQTKLIGHVPTTCGASSIHMQNFSLFTKSIPIAIRWLGSLALATLIAKTMWLNEIPAPFMFMFKLSGTINAVLESIIAAVIFFLIDVHYGRLRDRRLAGVNIGYSIKALAIQYSNMLAIIGIEDAATWIDGAPNFEIDRGLVRQKCAALDLNLIRPSQYSRQPTTPKSDFETLFNSRYKPHLAQINDNQFLKPHMDPKLIQLLTQFSYNLNMLAAHLDGRFPNGLEVCVTSIGMSSNALFHHAKNDLFYSLGMAQQIDGEDLFPPINQLT